MELSALLNSQYGFHAAIVGGVIVCVVLVFLLGFKSPQEPEFEKLTEDRKSSTKKKKVKDKKSSANGHVSTVTEKRQDAAKATSKKDVEKSPAKKQPQEKKSPKASVVDKEQLLKENRDSNGNRKSEKNLNQAKSKESSKGNKENVLNIKNKNKIDLDQDDDGEWEQAVSRRDKRSKKSVLEEILPQKSDKKKGKKKSDEEDNIDIQQPDTKILDVLNEIGLDAEAAVSVEEKPVAVKETKKSSKKKKPAPPEPSKPAPSEPPKPAEPSKPPAAAQVKTEVKQPLAVQEELQPSAEPEPVEEPKQIDAKPPRQKKQVDKHPLSGGDAGAVSVSQEEPVKQEERKEVTPPQPSPPASDTNVVFDELGDSWKEAKAPKKNSRKKTRVD